MRLGAIALRIRYKKTSFGDYVGGTAELDLAIQNTLMEESAFVIPLLDDAAKNNIDVSLNQRIIERFGVIVALKNDNSQIDKMGFAAYDRLHDVRDELIGALVGWIPIDAETEVSYRGGHLVDINNGYLWYQFEFDYDARIIMEGTTAKIQESNFDDTEEPIPFNTIYMQLIQTPSSEIPYTGDMPYGDNFPDVTVPNMANWIDLTVNLNAGAFAKRTFVSAFDVNK